MQKNGKSFHGNLHFLVSNSFTTPGSPKTIGYIECKTIERTN